MRQERRGGGVGWVEPKRRTGAMTMKATETSTQKTKLNIGQLLIELNSWNENQMAVSFGCFHLHLQVPQQNSFMYPGWALHRSAPSFSLAYRSTSTRQSILLSLHSVLPRTNVNLGCSIQGTLGRQATRGGEEVGDCPRDNLVYTVLWKKKLTDKIKKRRGGRRRRKEKTTKSKYFKAYT